MVQKLNLTRDQLSAFLQDHEQIKQFERLFQVVEEVSNAPDTQGAAIQAANAEASATLALGLIAALAQDAATNNAMAETKANQALELLDNLTKAVEGLQMAPVRNNVELAHDVNGTLPLANLPASVRSNQVLTWLSM